MSHHGKIVCYMRVVFDVSNQKLKVTATSSDRWKAFLEGM